MNASITNRFLVLIIGLILVFSFSFTVALAHDGEEHDDAMGHDDENSARIEQLKTLLALLTQLAEMLGERVEMHTGEMNDHEATEEADELSVKVEVHGDRTHVHVYIPDEEETSFFIDDYTIDQETEIIAYIATETGLTVAEIEAAATFPSDSAMEDDHDHEDDEDHDEEMDLDGIHIMSDGTVMLGNGEVLEDATVTDDGMIMLADGTEVEPEQDLR